MSKRIRLLPIAMIFFTGIVFFAGCNMFSFVGTAEKTPVEKSEEAIRNGDYAQAQKDLVNQSTGALVDSTDSMVLYTYCKATLLQSGLNFTKIVDLIQEKNGTQGTGGLSLLTTLDEMGSVKETAWYKANLDISRRLTPIWDNIARGELKKDDIALDFTVSSILSSILSLRDTNGDGVINSNDFQINLSKPKNGKFDGFGFSGASSTDASGKVTQFPGLTAFLGGTTKPAGIAGIPGYTPDDINRLINLFLTLLENGEESIVFMVQNATNSSYDINEVRQYVHQIASLVNFYWYNDGIDNDGDGRIDEETINGKDDDGDGLIDEDSNSNTPDITIYQAMFDRWQNR